MLLQLSECNAGYSEHWIDDCAISYFSIDIVDRANFSIG
jgi:hypothetical protein